MKKAVPLETVAEAISDAAHTLATADQERLILHLSTGRRFVISHQPDGLRCEERRDPS